MKTSIQIFGIWALLLWGAGQPVYGRAAAPRNQQAPAQSNQAQRELLRRQANGIFDRERQRARDGDCDTAATNAAIAQCLTQRIAITDLNLKTYESALRGLLALQPVGAAGPAPQDGSSTSPVAQFDQMEREWHAYLATATAAAGRQFGDDSGGPSTGMMTHLQLVRGHMKELDSIYYALLHL